MRNIVPNQLTTMGTLSQVFRYAVAAATMVPMFATALVISVVSSHAGWRIVRRWNALVLALFGISVETQFESTPAQLDQGGIIVGLDQQSILDPTIGYAAINHRFMALWNIEYALIPFFGWVSWILGWVIVRQWPEQAKRQLSKAANHARSGGLVYLSAEGQRSKDGLLNPYKKGPAVLAIQSQAPIHPLYLHGSRACLPHGEWRIRPGRVILRFLDPIPTTGLTYADRDQLLARLRALGEAEHRRRHQNSGSVA